jgi:hypothetical protein
MKRKRNDRVEPTAARPFQKKEEVLSRCLGACLQYNRDFNLPLADLSLYRAAEALDIGAIPPFIERIEAALVSGVPLDQPCPAIKGGTGPFT